MQLLKVLDYAKKMKSMELAYPPSASLHGMQNQQDMRWFLVFHN